MRTGLAPVTTPLLGVVLAFLMTTAVPTSTISRRLAAPLAVLRVNYDANRSATPSTESAAAAAATAREPCREEFLSDCGGGSPTEEAWACSGMRECAASAERTCRGQACWQDALGNCTAQFAATAELESVAAYLMCELVQLDEQQEGRGGGGGSSGTRGGRAAVAPGAAAVAPGAAGTRTQMGASIRSGAALQATSFVELRGRKATQQQQQRELETMSTLELMQQLRGQHLRQHQHSYQQRQSEEESSRGVAALEQEHFGGAEAADGEQNDAAGARTY
jgi:hypothetical protein